MEGWDWIASLVALACLAFVTLHGYLAQPERQYILVGFWYHFVWTRLLVLLGKVLWWLLVGFLKLLRVLVIAVWSLLLHVLWYHWEVFIGAGITTSALITTCIYGTWSVKGGVWCDLFVTIVCFCLDLNGFLFVLPQLRLHWKQCRLRGWQRMKGHGEMLDMNGPNNGDWFYGSLNWAEAAVVFDFGIFLYLYASERSLADKSFVIGTSLDTASVLWSWYLLLWNKRLRDRWEVWGWTEFRSRAY